MIKKHKKYSRPRKSYDKKRIEEEAKLIEEFGLKNKREIWKAESKVKLIKERAKKLITDSHKNQKAFFEKLNKIGFKVNSIADILSLDKKDYLQRRLQTIVFKKKLATTPNGARQLIVHKKVIVDGKIVDRPSYIVPVDLENKIYLKQKNKTLEIQESPKKEQISELTQNG